MTFLLYPTSQHDFSLTAMEVIDYGGPPIAKTQHHFEEQICDYPEKYTIWHPVYTGGSIGKNDGRSSPSVPYTIGTIDEGRAYNCHPGRAFSVTRSVYVSYS